MKLKLKTKISAFYPEVQNPDGSVARDRSIVLEYKIGPSFKFEIWKAVNYEITARVTNSKVNVTGNSEYHLVSKDHTSIDKELRTVVDSEFTATAYTLTQGTPEYSELMKEWRDARNRIIGDAAEGFFPKPKFQYKTKD